jgi:Domain of unknown function (DUF4112)
MIDQQQMRGQASSRAAEEPQVTGRAERIVYPPNPRLERIRFLANLLDTCIVLPGGFRIGLDPILGLIPGVGDVLGAALSLYLVQQASKLGIRKWILLKMVGNVAIETLLGTIPVIGDGFDAFWKANVRNLRLIELHYSPGRNAG